MVDDIVEKSMKNDSLRKEMGSYDGKWLEITKAKLLKQFDDKKKANLILSRMQKQMKRQKVNIGIYNLWRSDFYSNVSAKMECNI